MSVNDVVTLSIVAYDGDDARTVRALLPDAEERMDVVEPTTQPPGACGDGQRAVLLASFASLPAAVEASRLLPSSVTCLITARATLEDRQLVVLARYHIQQFLLADEFAKDLLQQIGCVESESEYVPPAYDELPWRAASTELPSPHRQDLYHLRHLANLESILGRDRLRGEYAEMAAQPPGWIDA